MVSTDTFVKKIDQKENVNIFTSRLETDPDGWRDFSTAKSKALTTGDRRRPSWNICRLILYKLKMRSVTFVWVCTPEGKFSKTPNLSEKTWNNILLV